MVDIQAILGGDRLALSRTLSQIENNSTEGNAALKALFPYTGKAKLIGVTGAPGTGKSSLVNQIAYHFRHPEEAKPQRVAIVAVDPSSPFSGGAVLGDRIRMTALIGDSDVYIRSMASRGSLGGLAKTTAGMVQAFDAAGYEIILIETVGAGQAEVDIAKLADTTLVVEAPGLGDDIQAIKAGILEIADILVVNKADRPGVENTERALRNMLNLAHPTKRDFLHHGQRGGRTEVENGSHGSIWLPPILKTVATEGGGVKDLIGSIADHWRFLEGTGGMKERERVRLAAELDQRLRSTLVKRWESQVVNGLYEKVLDRLAARELSPQEGVEELLAGGEQ